jgi:hypothetical protein
MLPKAQSAKFEQALVIALQYRGPPTPQVFLRGVPCPLLTLGHNAVYGSQLISSTAGTRGDIAIRSCTLIDCLQKLGQPAASHIAGSNGLCD